MRWNWGTGIAATYALFVLGTSGFVTFAIGRPVSLVREDYYAESLRQDDQARAVENARALGASVAVVNLDAQHLAISLPPSTAVGARGTVTLYRAADSKADRVLDLALDPTGRQVLPTAGMVRGHWIVQLRWTADGREYYYEQRVIVP
jgi:nitrogen fixation protein FixH